MRISEADWQRFRGYLEDTLAHVQLGRVEADEVLGFIESTKAEIVEVQ